VQRLLLLIPAWLALGACATEYPLDPTPCDDLCHATLRVACDEEPEDCVRNCELADLEPACEQTRQELTSCYSQAPNDAFVCVGDGFDSTIRVRDEICQRERDALLSCQEPDMAECLALCRPLQQQVVSAELATPTLPSREAPRLEAGLEDDVCLLLTEPCETLCWNLLSISALLVESPSQHDAEAPSSPESAIAEALADCEIDAPEL
jgi:hypothetical protein